MEVCPVGQLRAAIAIGSHSLVDALVIPGLLVDPRPNGSMNSDSCSSRTVRGKCLTAAESAVYCDHHEDTRERLATPSGQPDVERVLDMLNRSACCTCCCSG